MNNKVEFIANIGYLVSLPKTYGIIRHDSSHYYIVTARTYKFKNPNIRKIQSILNIILREYIFAMFILITLTGFSYLAVISLPYGGLGYMPGFLLGMIYLGVRFKLMDIFEKYI